jgi:hypothetical protein
MHIIAVALAIASITIGRNHESAFLFSQFSQ